MFEIVLDLDKESASKDEEQEEGRQAGNIDMLSL